MNNKLILLIILYLINATSFCQVLKVDSLSFINPNKLLDSILTNKVIQSLDKDSQQKLIFKFLSNPPKDSTTYYSFIKNKCLDSIFYHVETKNNRFISVGWKTRKIHANSITECNIGLHLEFYNSGKLVKYTYIPENSLDSIIVMMYDKNGGLTQFRKMPNLSHCVCDANIKDDYLYYQKFYKNGELKSEGYKDINGFSKTGVWLFYKKGKPIKTKKY